MGAYVGMAKFGINNKVNWALRGLLITITMHMAYDAFLFSTVSGGNSVRNALFALSIDAISLIIALLFIIRMEKIQGISLAEGDKVGVQAELLKRHRPTQTIGVLEIISHFGITGFILILCTLGCTSTAIYHCNLTFLTANSKYVLSTIVLGALALMFWKKTLTRVVSLNVTETCFDLRLELKYADLVYSLNSVFSGQYTLVNLLSDSS